MGDAPFLSKFSLARKETLITENVSPKRRGPVPGCHYFNKRNDESQKRETFCFGKFEGVHDQATSLKRILKYITEREY